MSWSYYQIYIGSIHLKIQRIQALLHGQVQYAKTYIVRLECIDPKERQDIMSLLENFLADAVRKITNAKG